MSWWVRPDGWLRSSTRPALAPLEIARAVEIVEPSIPHRVASYGLYRPNPPEVHPKVYTNLVRSVYW